MNEAKDRQLVAYSIGNIVTQPGTEPGR